MADFLLLLLLAFFSVVCGGAWSAGAAIFQKIPDSILFQGIKKVGYESWDVTRAVSDVSDLTLNYCKKKKKVIRVCERDHVCQLFPKA